jgi:cell division protein FtsB
MTLQSVSDYIKKHETLLIVTLAAVLITGGYSRLLGYLTHRDELAAQRSQIALQAQQQENARLAEQTAQTVKSYQDLVKQLDGQYHQLLAAQTKRDTDTKTQQAADRVLPPTEVASRWSTLIKLPVEQIQPTDTGYTVSPGVAVETLVQLETVPTLTADLQDEKQIVANKDQQLTGLNTVNAALNAELEGLRSEITKQDKACRDELTLVKASARKSKIKWFIGGVIVGALARNLAGL